MLATLVVAALLRFLGLGSGLWYDEIVTLVGPTAIDESFKAARALSRADHDDEAIERYLALEVAGEGNLKAGAAPATGPAGPAAQPAKLPAAPVLPTFAVPPPLNAGERVAILVGQGARGAADQVRELADKTGAGVAKALAALKAG